MKLLKLNFLIGILLFLFYLTTYSQGNNTSWLVGSTSGNVIYNPVTNLPIHADPLWTEFSVNPENSMYKLSDNKLNINTTNSSVFGYQLNGNSFLPKDTFTLDIKGENLTDTAAFGVNIRLSKGKNIKLNFKNNSIEDLKSKITLSRGITTVGMTNYRIVVAKDEAALYKDYSFVSTLNIQAADTIFDGGFEKMTSVDAAAYWGHDSYTGVSIVSDQKHSGNKSMKWENGWNGRFMGIINVQPNSSYTFTYWAKLLIVSAWGQTQMNGGIWIAGQQVADLPVKGDWTKYTCNFTTGPAVNEIELNYHNGWTGDGNFAICFDDFQLTRSSSDPFLQIGNLKVSGASNINVGKLSFINGKAFKPVTLADLTQLTGNCQLQLSLAQSGSGTGNFPQYAIDRFSTSIIHANKISSSLSVTPENIDLAFNDLQNANSLFQRSKIVDAAITLSSVLATTNEINLKSNFFAQISVTGKLSDNNTADLSVAKIQYNSLNPLLLSVDTTGKVTSVSPGIGNVEVVVQLNDKVLKDTVEFVLIDYKLTTVDFKPYNAIVETGEATGTQIIAKMTDGSVLQNTELSTIYRSLTPAISDVNDIGTVIAKSKGLAKIEVAVSVFGKTMKDTANISVISLESISLTPAKMKLEPNEITIYSLNATFSDGSSLPIDNTNAVIWSSNRNVIKVDDNGHLKADSIGSSEIQFILKRSTIAKSITITLTVIKNSTGIITIESNLDLIYPMPFDNSFIVTSPEGIRNIQLTDLSGKGVLNIKVNGEISKMMNVSFLHSGIYVLTVTDVFGKMNISKIIKK